jgi:hypothetical protein
VGGGGGGGTTAVCAGRVPQQGPVTQPAATQDTGAPADVCVLREEPELARSVPPQRLKAAALPAAMASQRALCKTAWCLVLLVAPGLAA